MAKEEKDKQAEDTGASNDQTAVIEEPSLDQQIEELLSASPKNEGYRLLKTKIDQQNEELKNLRNQYLQQVADNRNIAMRRDEVERKLRKYGARKLGELIVPDIDLFKKVLSASENNASAEVQNYLKGFEMIVTKFDYSLGEVGIREVKIAAGTDFDSRTMEAVEQLETTETESGKVVETISNIYMLYDEVLIHGKVKVAK